MKINFIEVIKHVAAIVIFYMIALMYCQPVMDGKVLESHDDMQFRGASHEAVSYRETTGEEALWTNSMFGGMPTYLISYRPTNNFIYMISQGFLGIFPVPVKYLFSAMVCFYIMLLTFKFKPFASFMGAVAFGLASYNIIIIGAGHYAKMVAISFFPLVIAGINLVFDRKYLWGAVLTGAAMCIEVGANHPQMTYYYFAFFVSFYMIALIWGQVFNRAALAVATGSFFSLAGAMLVKYFRSPKEMKHTGLSVIIVGGAIVLGVAANLNRFMPVNEYTPFSTRGKTELVRHANNNDKTSGLNRSYIVGYSYGRGDIMSLLVPNFKGPRNGQLLANPIAKKNIPAKDQQLISGVEGLMYENYGEIIDQYWGEQDSAGGAFYLSVIIFALFLLGLVFVKHPLRWVAIPAFLIPLMLSWGKNYMGFTNFFIDHFPMYSKFRAVNSIVIVIEFIVPLLAAFMVATMLNEKGWMDKVWMGKIKNKFAVLGGAGFIVLVLLMMYAAPTTFQRFFKPNMETRVMNPATGQPESRMVTEDVFISDILTQAQLPQAQIDSVLDGIESGRVAIFRADAVRSLLVMVVFALVLLLWAFVRFDYPEIWVGILSLVVLVDLWTHDQRYLNERNFRPKKKVEFAQTTADKSILQDTSPDYRVLNLSVNTFSDATTSYYHKSLGGYHGAKMKRYQELVENCIYDDINKLAQSKATSLAAFDSVFRHTQVLNMLNTKYIILSPEQPALPNTRAFGPAWIVQRGLVVPDADTEIDSLKTADLSAAAVVDKRFEAQLKGHTQLQPRDSAAYIRMLKYSPHHLEYEFNSSKEELVVFSAIYYPKGWQAAVDGNVTEHFRANYVLRAMIVPAGKHTVTFDFNPASYRKGEMYALIGSGLILLGLIGGLAMELYKLSRKQPGAKAKS